MSIVTEITRLQNAKSSLKSSIEAKGVTVASDATLDAYPALVDSIPSGGGGLQEKDVNFYDYDGTLLYAYTKQEFLALASMPDNPDRTSEGLASQGWNWTLSDAKENVSANGWLDIGQLYSVTDGKTKIEIEVTNLQENTMCLHLKGLTETSSGTIDWGDGSSIETVDVNSGKTYHQYSSIGKYTIIITVVSGKLTSNYTSQYQGGLFGDCAEGENTQLPVKVIIGPNFKLYNNAFIGAVNLKTILLPYNLYEENNFDRKFSGCSSLRFIILPPTITRLGLDYFSNCRNLSLVLSRSVTYFDSAPFITAAIIRVCDLKFTTNSAMFPSWSCKKVSFSNDIPCIYTLSFYNTAINTIVFPQSMTEIKSLAFGYCYFLRSIVLYSTIPPTLASDAFVGLASSAVFYVPAASVEAYKTATN